jgi:predicted dehydrogenase
MPKPIKFALIGCGHIASRWLDAFQSNPSVDLVAIADPDPATFDQVKKYKFPNVQYFSTIEQAYVQLKVDAVVIATPPQYHARYIIWALEQGIHVLAEKPLCVSLSQLKHIAHALSKAEKGVMTAVNQQYRWNPRVEVIHDTVHSGKLGDIFLVNSEFNQNNYHFKKWWRQQEEYITLFNWYVHMIDSMRYYLGKKPVKVWAKFIHPSHSKILGYSSLLMNVTFEDGIEWHLTANQESVAGPTTSGHTRFTMYGSQGTLTNTKNDPPFLHTFDGKKHELGDNIADVDNATTYPPGWEDNLEKFIHSINTGEEHPTSIQDNLWTVAILFAAIKSFELKHECLISEILSELE